MLELCHFNSPHSSPPPRPHLPTLKAIAELGSRNALLCLLFPAASFQFYSGRVSLAQQGETGPLLLGQGCGSLQEPLAKEKVTSSFRNTAGPRRAVLETTLYHPLINRAR